MGYADTIITGRIFRGLREGFAEALAIHGDRIVAVGRRDAVMALWQVVFGASAVDTAASLRAAS